MVGEAADVTYIYNGKLVDITNAFQTKKFLPAPEIVAGA